MIFFILSIILNLITIYNGIIIYSLPLYPILMYKKKKNIIFSYLICGLILDLFLSSCMINTIILILIYLFINLFFKYKKYNLKNVIIVSIFSIFTYNSIYYLSLIILKHNIFPYVIFLNKLLYILFLNLVYVTIMFLIINNKNINKI